LVTIYRQTPHIARATDKPLRLKFTTRIRPEADPNDITYLTIGHASTDDNAEHSTMLHPGATHPDDHPDNQSLWKTTHTPYNQHAPIPTHPNPTKRRGNISALPNAAHTIHRQTHMRLKTKRSQSSMSSLCADPPPNLPSTSR
jgi:hypothetical protein